MRLWLLVVAACESTPMPPPEPPTPTPTPQPMDAAVPDAPPDAPLALIYRCNGRMTVKGHMHVRIDPATQAGYIERLTSGPALWRKIYVTAKRSGDELALIFDRYDAEDHTTIKGKRAPRPAAEKLVRGTSVVARLVTVGVDDAKLHVDGAVDWVTGSFLAVTDNVAVCTPPRNGEP